MPFPRIRNLYFLTYRSNSLGSLSRTHVLALCQAPGLVVGLLLRQGCFQAALVGGGEVAEGEVNGAAEAQAAAAGAADAEVGQLRAGEELLQAGDGVLADGDNDPRSRLAEEGGIAAAAQAQETVAA